MWAAARLRCVRSGEVPQVENNLGTLPRGALQGRAVTVRRQQPSGHQPEIALRLIDWHRAAQNAISQGKEGRVRQRHAQRRDQQLAK